MRTWKARLAGLLAAALLAAAAASPASAAGPFRDLPAGHWAADDIGLAVQLGLIQGETADTFGVGRPMTRAAFVMMLCRVFGWETVTPKEGSFADNRDRSAPYYSAVETALANGALTGQSGRFRPEDAVTREEMTVMLMRSLGYTTLAGLELGLKCPFQDVESNRTYLTMAWYLGIAGGTTVSAFSPDDAATREQAVVMLMRVREKLGKTAPERIGLASSTVSVEDTDFTPFDAVAVSGVWLTPAGEILGGTSEEQAQALRDAIRVAGAKALLRVSGGQTAMRGETAKLARAAADAAADYDGVFLDVADLTKSERQAHAALVRELRALLGDKPLFVTAEAPSTAGAGGGYDYASLSRTADRLILRVPSYSGKANGFPTLPQEPLEEVYYALASLKPTTELSNCSLWLTAAGAVRREGGSSNALRTEDIQALLAKPDTKTYYSARYADAYLVSEEDGRQTVVWYHDRRAARARVLLGAFFDVESVCVSDLTSVADDPAASLFPGLW